MGTTGVSKNKKSQERAKSKEKETFEFQLRGTRGGIKRNERKQFDLQKLGGVADDDDNGAIGSVFRLRVGMLLEGLDILLSALV